MGKKGMRMFVEGMDYSNWVEDLEYYLILGILLNGVILRGSSFSPPSGLTDKHTEHLFTISSTSASKPGHHSLERMNCLVLVIPICVECANFNALSLKTGGNTIR